MLTTIIKNLQQISNGHLQLSPRNILRPFIQRHRQRPLHLLRLPFSTNSLLLHGFPSSSTQFRNLIPLLSQRYHILAPDLPGFGLTTVPEDFAYTFDNLAAVTSAWIAALALPSFALYIFDYGAPVGLRIALQRPDKVKAIISQNGNAYDEGFGKDFWAPIFALWESSNAEPNREMLQDNILTLPTTKFQYVAGVPTADLPWIDPALTYHHDYLSNLTGEANAKHQLDLFYDYRNNVKQYPQFQEYFRKSQVPILAVWGKGDPAFVPAGADAFKKDSPGATIRFVDAGHFALETKAGEIAGLMLSWLSKIEF